ncbi:cation diffusion facilitator family transporter [Reyranella sp.]|uniref:cation diffusion facilitator family transporter n=1 Tax=Reyranella sp. TaxID=1929291 RepID=UPI003C7B0ECA
MEPQRLMRLATVASISTALLLIVAKFAAWRLTDSVSMLSSLVDTSLDLVSSMVTFFAVRQSLVPADDNHRFGHGKAEGLAGLIQAGFIAASGCALLVAIVERLGNPRQVREEGIGLAVSAVAIGLTLCLVTFQKYVVRRSGSLAISADMAHYNTDLVATLVTGAGVFLSGLLDLPLIDSGVAALVALYLMHGAWNVGRESLNVLMDHELPAEDSRKIEAIARAHPGVKDAHDLKTRSSGLTRFIQLHIEVDRDLSVVLGHAIGLEVQAEIARAFPGAEIIIHVDPSPAL